MIKDVQEIIIAIMAALSLVLSYRTHLRQKTFENENHVYKYNLDRYLELLTQISDFIIFLQDIVEDLYDDTGSYKVDGKEEGEILDELYMKLDNFRFEIYPKVALLPEKIVTTFDDFIDTLDETDILPTEKVDSYDTTQTKIDKVAEKIDLIELAMREDLHLETLNSNLNKRLQSNRRKRR